METNFVKMSRKNYNALKPGTIIRSSCGYSPTEPIIDRTEITKENKEHVWQVIKANRQQGRMFFVEE